MTILEASTTVSAMLRAARAESGLTLRELAARAGTSHPTLSAYESGRKTPNIATLARVLAAAGFALDLEVSPRLPGVDRVARGEELREVLELAALFPARHAASLAAPIFGSDGS